MANHVSECATVRVERNVETRMRDDTVLRADVYRPAEAGTWPVLLLRTPYGKAIAQTSAYAHPAWYCRHGYVVVVQDMRGRFESEGTFTPFAHEAADGYDTVRWAASLPGTTRAVGLYGFSYPGAAGYLTAATRPPELRCAALACTSLEFNDGWLRRGGALQVAFTLHWFVNLLAIPDAAAHGFAARVRELLPLVADLERRSMLEPVVALAAGYPGVLETLHHWLGGERTAPLRPDCLEEIRIPILTIGGWFDCFSAGTVAIYERLRERATDSRLIMGPWLHAPWTPLVGAQDFGPAAVSTIDSCQLAWFDAWLKGDGPRAGGLPGANVFVGGRREWRALEEWPPPNVVERSWYLHSRGRAAVDMGDGGLDPARPDDEPADVFVFNPASPVPTHGGTCCCAEEAALVGVRDQTAIAARTDVAVYTSEVLSEDIEVQGAPKLVLFAASSAADLDWIAKLIDVDPAGGNWNVCDGVQRVVSTVCSPGVSNVREYECELHFAPTAHVFKAGHRLRILLANSDFPQFEINCGDGSAPGHRVPMTAAPCTVVIYHQQNLGSRLLLPITP